MTGVNDELVALGQGDRSVLELADPDFRALQIHDHADVLAMRLAALARRLCALGVDFVPVVREIEPHDIHPGLEQLVQYFGVVRGRTEGSDDFGSTLQLVGPYKSFCRKDAEIAKILEYLTCCSLRPLRLCGRYSYLL